MTPSPIITIHFQTQNADKSDSDTDYECTMDGQITPCGGGSRQYKDLTTTPHTFQVRVNDPNTKHSTPAIFKFNVTTSIQVRGIVSQNISVLPKFQAVLNDNTSVANTDDDGTFKFPFVFYKEDKKYNFTIYGIGEQGQKLRCDSKSLYLYPNGNVAQLPSFNIDKTDCSKTLSLDKIGINDTEVFVPEKKLQFGRIDLLYNTTLIRKPSSGNSHDGLWNIVLYVDGPELFKVSHVKYFLHPTYARHVVTVTPQDNPNFSLHLSAYDSWKVYAKVYFVNNTVLDFTRYLILRY